LGRLALCLALGGSTPEREGLAVPENLDDESLFVVRSVLVHDSVFGKRQAERLRRLLESRLVVVKRQIADVDTADVGSEEPVDERSRRPKTSIDGDRPHHR